MSSPQSAHADRLRQRLGVPAVQTQVGKLAKIGQDAPPGRWDGGRHVLNDSDSIQSYAIIGRISDSGCSAGLKSQDR